MNGIATSSSSINFFIDNQLIDSVTTQKDGAYTKDLILPEGTVFGTHVLKAVLDTDEAVSSTAILMYSSDAPSLVQFDMYYYAHSLKKIDLLAAQGISFTRMIYPGKEFTFNIKFDNYDQLGDVFVISSKNGETVKMKANPVDNKGNYIAQGYFEGTEKRYVPGTINVYYTLNTDPSDLSADMKETELPNIWKNASVDVKKNTETEFEAEFSLQNDETVVYSYQEYTLEEAKQLFLNEESLPNKAKKIQKASTDEELEAVIDFGKKLGEQYKDNVISNGKDVYILHKEKENKFVYIFWDSLKSAFVSESITFVGTAWVYENSPGVSWHDSGMVWGFIYDGAKVVVKGYNQAVALDDAKREIYSNTTMSQEEKEYALSKIDQLRWGYAALGLLRVASCAAKYAIKVGVTAQFGPVAGIAAEFLASALCNQLLGLAEQYLDQSRAYYVAGGQGSRLKWLIDPSGYIFDIDTEERLVDVTVTAYYIPNDDSTDFWSEKPSETTYGVVWDANEYSQVNPVLTDSDGCYAWDVPDGWWRVKVEKEGYATTWSEWLPVPPPQTTVNIGLTKTDNDHTHTYTATITTSPTCTADGETTYTCECGDTYTEPIPATGDHVDKNNDGKCDTCGEKMTGGKHCKYCGKIHGGAFGWLVKFFHSIFAIFKR